MKKSNDVTDIEFNRTKKYRRVRDLGNGACGQTVLLYDKDMNVEIVAKKYRPIISKNQNSDFYSELMDRFKEEARFLFQLNHPNVVRVYNYYDYRENDTAYIIMEYVLGHDIVEYVKLNPVSFDHIFEKLIDGFEHLEQKGILHRDIRPANILVTTDGEPKIIDFGFGKQLDIELNDKGKSISLNLWCEAPAEFSESVYAPRTEVYFLGKLFQHVILEAGLSGTKYDDVIRRMCEKAEEDRFASFQNVREILNQQEFDSLQFSDHATAVYRSFADALSSLFGKLGAEAIINKDASSILDKLDHLYQTTQLEIYIPQPVTLCRIFVSGEYTYYSDRNFKVEILNDFRSLLRKLSGGKREIVIANLSGRLEAIPKKQNAFQNFTQDLDDEIPF